MENKNFIAMDLNGNYVRIIPQIVDSKESANSYLIENNLLRFVDTGANYVLEKVCQSGWQGDNCDVPSNKDCVCDCSVPLPDIPSVLIPDVVLQARRRALFNKLRTRKLHARYNRK